VTESFFRSILILTMASLHIIRKEYLLMSTAMTLLFNVAKIFHAQMLFLMLTVALAQHFLITIQILGKKKPMDFLKLSYSPTWHLIFPSMPAIVRFV